MSGHGAPVNEERSSKLHAVVTALAAAGEISAAAADKVRLGSGTRDLSVDRMADTPPTHTENGSLARAIGDERWTAEGGAQGYTVRTASASVCLYGFLSREYAEDAVVKLNAMARAGR